MSGVPWNSRGNIIYDLNFSFLNDPSLSVEIAPIEKLVLKVKVKEGDRMTLMERTFTEALLNNCHFTNSDKTLLSILFIQSQA